MAEPPAGGPLILLDGMSLAFRAYFALSADLTTSDGAPTNALHGFAAMVHTLVRTWRPRALAVAFDLPGGSFRNRLVEDYKGGRAATPPQLEPQFDFIRALCEALAIPVIGVPDYEADDILATLATRARDHQHATVVVSGDRDTFQLVEDPYVRVLYNRRGVSEYDLYDEAGIVARCGIEPARYPLLAAMRGDASDNLPGVPGVGEKTAARLLTQFGDLNGIFAHLDELTPKLRENLAIHQERARHNADVMALVRDVPVDVDLADLAVGGWRRSEIETFFDRFDMATMRRRFAQLLDEGLLGAGAEDRPVPGRRAGAVVPAARLVDLDDLAGAPECVIAARGGHVAVLDASSARVAVVPKAQWIASYDGSALAGHDIKGLVRELLESGRQVPTPRDDSALMAYLVDSVSGRYDLDAVAERFVALAPAATSGQLFDDGTGSALIEQVSRAAAVRAALRREIATWQLEAVYEGIELPLVTVLARMEMIGVGVDVTVLRAIADEFAAEAAQLDQEIQVLAGHPFTVNSSPQIQMVLFTELGLRPVRKIKTGFSTDAASLEAMADQHPIVGRLLRYREVEKLRSTYGVTLIDSVGPDGRIHAIFNQMVARTGRISSEGPNLHNIPVRTTEGRRLRTAFVPPPGWWLAVADYNQIELRILAHLSQDQGLLAAFAAGRDVHRQIAALVFGVAPEQVTHEQREQAKAVSYGLAYGMETFGLSQRLGLPVAHAREIMDRYFTSFPTVRHYMERTVAEIRERGFSRTEAGRIRPFPDLATATGASRAAAERQAMNAGIQGMAADVFKSALVRLDHALTAGPWRSRLVLQVHDEVVVEVPDDERATVSEVIAVALTEAATLSVPLEISLRWGRDWATAKG